MIELSVFAVVTLILGFISRRSLANMRSHGYWRFLAWECITALILANLSGWIRDPWTWNQIFSWVLLILSLVLLGFGVPSLIRQGGGQRQDAQGQLFGMERTTRLVTQGIYKYIRHPMYSSLLLLAWGAYFKAPLGIGILLVISATGFLVATARADERECVAYFGPAYVTYMQDTRRFIPFVF